MSSPTLQTGHSLASDRWLLMRVAAGLVAYLAAVGLLTPRLLETSWAYILLLFAPLVLVPVGLRLAVPLSWPGRLAAVLQLPCAVLLAVSFLRPSGTEAALWSLPWLVVTALVCVEGLVKIVRRGLWPITELCFDCGLVFLLIGGLWTTASRAALHPMGFDDTIVLLTANHFHYAGFVVPLVAGLCAREMRGRVADVTALGVLAGVPLVALGITATKYRFSPLLECVAALVMAASGLFVAWLQIRLARREGPALVRWLWAVAGVSLGLGMVLAALYGVRFLFATDRWLTIPWMRAIHGSVNVFGFALAALSGWWLWDSGHGGKATTALSSLDTP